MLNEYWLRLQLHGEIYRPDSFVLMLRYCANLKAIRYESTSLNRIAADKSLRVIVALHRNEVMQDNGIVKSHWYVQYVKSPRPRFVYAGTYSTELR